MGYSAIIADSLHHQRREYEWMIRQDLPMMLAQLGTLIKVRQAPSAANTIPGVPAGVPRKCTELGACARPLDRRLQLRPNDEESWRARVCCA
jgi:hypothetical protein